MGQLLPQPWDRSRKMSDWQLHLPVGVLCMEEMEANKHKPERGRADTCLLLLLGLGFPL